MVDCESLEKNHPVLGAPSTVGQAINPEQDEEGGARRATGTRPSLSQEKETQLLHARRVETPGYKIISKEPTKSGTTK